LFLLNGVEEEDDRATEEAAVFAAKEEAPMLSLQALAGVAFSDTMQLEVQLGSASLVALLDSGSTHNFISEAAALRTGLPLQHRPRLTTMVANGERVACVGVLRGAPLTIHGASFPADLYFMPLAGYTSSSAPGGSPRWARSCGISAPARSPSRIRAAPSAGKGWRALVYRP
jgi:hypothetical protein